MKHIMRHRFLLLSNIRPSSTRVLAPAHHHPASLLNHKPRHLSSRFKKPVFDLEHFLVRQKVISLWREIIRGVYKIPPSSTRAELLNYAKAEFVRNRELTDSEHIKYLVSAGKAEFDTMRRYIDELAAR